MKPGIQYFVRIFFSVGLIFGLLMGVNPPKFDGFYFTQFWYSFLLFGGIFGLVSTLVQVNAVKKLGIVDYSIDDLGVKHKRSIHNKLDLRTLMDELKKEDYFSKAEFAIEAGKVTIKKKRSFFLPAEKIEITKPSSATMEVISSPASGAPIMDGGGNLKNVIFMQELLEK